MPAQGPGRKEKALLEKLGQGLSEAELRRVLGSALTTMAKPERERLCAKLGPETGQALRRMLQPAKKNIPPRRSSDKVRQDWKRAWADWDAVISNAGCEDGEYLVQEHHWEEPYFDSGSVADDLEPIAATMRKLVPRVFDDKLAPNFSFAEAISESVADISAGLPEWMNPFEADGITLGPQVTGCLLDWEWRAARRDGRTAFQLLDDIRQMESSVEGPDLDADTIVDFVRDLDREARQEVHRGIQANRQEEHWRQTLDSAHSPWFHLYQELCRDYDPGSYLENCLAGIGQDWTLALPVIRELQRGKEHAKVAELCGRSLRSYQHLRADGTWEPGENLIATWRAQLDGEKPDSRLLQILGAWKKAAATLGHDEAAAALELQAELLVSGPDWDKALAAFRRAPLARFPRVQQRLFALWRDRTAHECLAKVFVRGYCEPPKSSHWVHALIDAAWQGPDGSAVFLQWVRGWFRAIDDRPEDIGKDLTALALLTLDLDGASRRRGEFPTLVRLIGGNGNAEPALRASRRQWLERTGCRSLLPELIGLWRRHGERLVPDPQQAGSSDYDHCADWVRALHELNPTAGRNLLARWETPHRRRKNLWKALRKRGLPEAR